MKGSLEDRLAMLAFGELSVDEAAKLEAEIQGNSEALRTLQEFRAMKGGLKGLGDVPEHQLSSERLKNAILSRGLEANRPQKPGLTGLGWLWMPVGAAALALVVLNLKTKRNEVPTLVLGSGALNGGSVARNFPESTLPKPIFRHGSEPTPQTRVALGASQIREAPMASEVPLERDEVMAPQRHAPVKHRLRKRTRVRQPQASALFTNDVTQVAVNFKPKVAVEKPVVSVALASDKPSIVHIGNESDSNTGALTATDVKPGGNLRVGY
jgi:anti-sigma factor RsiW